MGTSAIIVLCSTKIELKDQRDFVILKDRPEFPATGLEETSYLILDPPRTIQASLLTKRLGEATGHLRHELEDWWGEPFS